MSFNFTVVEIPEKQIAGIYVQTTIQDASKDCPALWQSFGPRMCDTIANCNVVSKTGPSYGVNVMLDENKLNYWAALEVTSTSNLPKDLQTMTIPGGLYVKCTAQNLAQLGDAYTALYMQWPQSQHEYAVNMQAPCFELYSHNWQLNDPIEIYAPIVKK